MRTELEIARAAALAGGEVVAERGPDYGSLRVKGDPSDYVTDVDIESGVAVVRAIQKRMAAARFVVEEAEVYECAGIEEASLDEPEVWVIDPLDGTTSFVHGFPCYSVSIALLRDGEPVAGAVYNVPLGQMASAATGEGAWLGTQRITCSSAASLDSALMATGFPYDRTRALERQLRVLAAFLRAPVHGVRRDGSAAIDCVHVAAGRVDGFWEFGLKPWDTAAGVVLLREASARVTDITGADWSTDSYGILAANPTLHAQMLDVVLASEEEAQ